MTHTLLATCPFGNDGDGIEVVISYNFTKGHPQINPSLNAPGEPADPHEVEFVLCHPVHGVLTDWPEAQKRLDDWASEALADELYERACREAQEDNR